jgi:hypothetical protein
MKPGRSILRNTVEFARVIDNFFYYRKKGVGLELAWHLALKTLPM